MKKISERKKSTPKKEEKKEHKSEETYRALLDSIEEAYFEDDLAGNFTFVNKALCKHLGYSREELIGMNYTHYTGEKTAEKLRKLYGKVYRTGKPIKAFDLEAIRKDGTKAIHESSVSLIRNSQGNPIGFRGISRDVTKRKNTEDELHSREQRMQSIFRAAPIGIGVLVNRVFSDVNNRVCEMTGYGREELLGQSARLLYPTQNDFDYVGSEKYRQIAEKGTGSVETHWRKKDGAIIDILLSSTPIDQSDLSRGVTFTALDITERKKIEEDLSKSEEKYRTLLDNASDAILLANDEGNLLEVNKKAEELLGYTRQELLGVHIANIHPPEELERTINGFSEINRNGVGTVNNAAVLKKDGKTVFVDISGSVIEYSGKKVLQGIFRDITERKLAEEALRQSEEKYRTILESTDYGYYETDLSGNFTFVNDVICKRLGYPKEKLIGMNNRQYTDQVKAKEYYALYNKVFKTGESLKRHELEHVRKDGTKWYTEVSIALIRDAQGKPIGFRGVSQDITERKQMGDDLRKSEEKYRTILESIDDGYYEVDLNGNYTFFNEAEAKNLGYTKEELLGMNNRQYQDEATAKKTYEAFLEIYRTGQPLKALEMAIIRKDGSIRVNEISASLMLDAEGKPIGFRGITRDITQRRQMEEALRQSEEKYRLILENMEEGYFEIDLGGNYTFVNNAECRNLGYPKEELIGMNNRQYQDKATSRKMYQVFRNMYKTGEPVKIIDLEIIQKDGTKRFNEISVSLIRDSKGGKIGFSGVSRDITERKRAEEVLQKNREELIRKNRELEESRKNVQLTLERLGAAYEELKTSQAKILQQEKMASIGQLAAGVAHEINNPMAFIASNLGTLDKYIRRLKDFIQAQSEAIKSLKAADAIKKLEKKRKELKLDYTIDDIDLLVKESIDGSERVQKIVQELNRFSRVDDAEYKDTNINECIESSINIVWNELKHKATLEKDYGNLPLTRCYPQKLNQVFVNLLVNAIQAIEEKGKIKIKTWEKDGSIWVMVSDTGHGIPRENQSKIFEPFFTTKEVGKGTGLGLSISYEIIQRHKGEISFESKEGMGTTFAIRMPIV